VCAIEKTIPSQRQKIKPFEPFNRKTQAPFWWDIYNHTKHDLHEYFEKVTLRQTRDALAGAFLLNVIYEPASLRLLKYGLLKPKYRPEGFEIIYPTFKGHEIYPETPKGETENPFTIETPLFIYDYENEKEKQTLRGY